MAIPNMAPAAGPQDQAQKQGDQGAKRATPRLRRLPPLRPS